jgi:beta-glucanase (GH16 family)
VKKLGLTLFTISILIPFWWSAPNRKPADTGIKDKTAMGWILTFQDEFDSADVAVSKGAKAECFSRKPDCANEFEWDTSTCDEKYHAQLKDLNKCNWKVYNTYNWMDFSATPEQAVNSFHPSKVKVENGNLILSADRSPIPKDQFNCKKPYQDSRFGFEALSRECAIYSGGVNSQQQKPIGSTHFIGFSQAYGRFEVRAKLPKGQGSWPAIWMMPQDGAKAQFPESGKDCGWPYIGEIDLMEQWSDNFKKVASGYIHGYCKQKLDVREGFDSKLDRTDQNFYVYGLEWGENYICFYQNDRYSGCIYKDDLLRAKNLVENKRVGKEKAWIASYPFYWILNLTIEPALKRGKIKVNPDTFEYQEMVIDYVRSYRRCTDQDPKSSCRFFTMSGDWGTSSYNSNRGETASASLNVFPNPASTAVGDAGLSFRLNQSCNQVKIDLINSTGQLTSIETSGQPSSSIIFNGSLQKDELLEKSLRVSNLKSGLYTIRSEFAGCGDDQSGKGNQSFKLVMMDDRQFKKFEKEKGELNPENAIKAPGMKPQIK